LLGTRVKTELVYIYQIIIILYANNRYYNSSWAFSVLWKTGQAKMIQVCTWRI